MTHMTKSFAVTSAAVLILLGGFVQPARALDRLCDPGNENCRTILINYIRQETVGIDVGFWFMEDARYTSELISRFNAGVPVRVIMDTRANATNAYNAQRLAELQAAGIPMRRKTTSGIMHYKMMLFAGQQVVEFSGANFSADAWTYTGDPYTNYTDESIYFTDDPAVVHSFMTKYDDLWTDTSSYTNYANVSDAQLARNYPTYTKDPELNFPPAESYANRAIGRYNKETQRIDVIMYRITDRRHTDAVIAAKARGVAVRLISDPQQYRDPTRLWDAWNVDRLYMAGIPIRMRAHAGLNHQKLVILYGLGMSIFGSSNWTSASDRSQEEHNYFTQKPDMLQWFKDQFERKWNNTAGVVENTDFVPLPPDKPQYHSPADGASGLSTSSVQLKWNAGPWAHKYDVYLGPNPNNLSLVLSDQELGPSESSSDYKSFTASNLAPGTTYYWRIVSRTMANKTKTGDLWSFTTAGTAEPPPPTGTSGPGDIVIYGLDGTITGSVWTIVDDAGAAGAKRLWNPNKGTAKMTTASASPSSYVTFTFDAVAGQAYHLWMRGRADDDIYPNDSVFVQFSNATTSNGTPAFRIGTTSAAEYNLEDCSGCGISGWGWQDNGWGVGVLGPAIYFDRTGTQTLRIQNREDGLSIDRDHPVAVEVPELGARRLEERRDDLRRDAGQHGGRPAAAAFDRAAERVGPCGHRSRRSGRRCRVQRLVRGVHRHGRRRRHLGHLRRVPLRLPEHGGRRIDRRAGADDLRLGGLGEGRRDDPGLAGRQLGAGLHAGVARQGSRLPAAHGDRWHEHEHRRLSHGRPVLGPAGSRRQHDHRLRVGRRHQLDARRERHDSDGNDGLCWPGRLEPLEQRSGHGHVRPRAISGSAFGVRRSAFGARSFRL